jgi:hypothetical protein
VAVAGLWLVSWWVNGVAGPLSACWGVLELVGWLAVIAVAWLWRGCQPSGR